MSLDRNTISEMVNRLGTSVFPIMDQWSQKEAETPETDELLPEAVAVFVATVIATTAASFLGPEVGIQHRILAGDLFRIAVLACQDMLCDGKLETEKPN